MNIYTDPLLALTTGIRQLGVGNPEEFDPCTILGMRRDCLERVIKEKFELMGTVGRA